MHTWNIPGKTSSKIHYFVILPRICIYKVSIYNLSKGNGFHNRLKILLSTIGTSQSRLRSFRFYWLCLVTFTSFRSLAKLTANFTEILLKMLRGNCMPHIAINILIDGQDTGALIFQNSMSHVKIVGARKVTWSKFHSEDPQIIGGTVKNVVP